jgi:hypothetical protein
MAMMKVPNLKGMKQQHFSNPKPMLFKQIEYNYRMNGKGLYIMKINKKKKKERNTTKKKERKRKRERNEVESIVLKISFLLK